MKLKNKNSRIYINYVRVQCECGHTMNFLSNHSAMCNYCGRTVYPSKRCQFKEKLEKERRKNHGIN